MSDDWGPWHEHDGNGVPAWLKQGMVVQLELADPRRNMEICGRVQLTLGTLGRVSDFMFSVPEAEGDSWTLPITAPDLLYVARFRVLRPRALIELRRAVAELPDEVAA